MHVSTSFIILSTPKIFPYTLGLPCHPGTIEAHYHVCKMRKNILCPGFCCLKKRVLYFTTNDGTMYDIFTYIWLVNVGKYTSPMDTVGNMFQFQLATSIKICEICTGQPAWLVNLPPPSLCSSCWLPARYIPSGLKKHVYCIFSQDTTSWGNNWCFITTRLYLKSILQKKGGTNSFTNGWI